MRDVKVTLDLLLDLVLCTDDFGYMFFSAIAELTGNVSDDEIAMYAAQEFLTDEALAEGYTHEDYSVAVKCLTEWRNEYCFPTTEGVIEGVAYFVRDTKPTERNAENPTPLVVGDRWHKTDDDTKWFWNGTYWKLNE